MKAINRYILLLLLALPGANAAAQTQAQTQALYNQGKYEEAKPGCLKLVKAQPANGNYNLWYGVCCLKTQDAEEAVKYLETAVKRRATGGQLYLGQAYEAVYRYEDATRTYEAYIAELQKRKRPTDEAERLLKRSKNGLRMLKGVEKVCFIDSFVVDKEQFLQAYKISPETGSLSMYNTYFDHPSNAGSPSGTGKQTGTVYETEMGNKVYYGELQADSTYHILLRNRMSDGWSNAHALPDNINQGQNANYPYVSADGITMYYAADGDESMGGYDIFVTRYNPDTDSYLSPENVGMPFNSPYNDYLYVIDEFNNLGWFASDRRQPEGKVCIYVFIPNDSKQVYDYEEMEGKKLASLARITSIQESRNDPEAVAQGRQRLQEALAYTPQAEKHAEFEFVIDDRHTYHQRSDFRSPQAKERFGQYLQLEQSYQAQRQKLDDMRARYAAAQPGQKSNMAPAILDLEKRIRELGVELKDCAIEVRKLEKQSNL